MNARESDAHTIHRIEAFSDIVIGFCIAEIGANLVLPKSVTDINTLWVNAGFFLVAFAFIVIMWWFHHRIFTTYFVLNAFSLVMNFVILAGLVLTVYFLQVFVHAAASDQNPRLFFVLWAYSFANVYTLLGILLVSGMWMRRAELARADLRWGVQRTASIAMAVVFFVIIAAPANWSNGANAIARTALLAGIAMVLIGRVILPFVLKRVVPDR